MSKYRKGWYYEDKIRKELEEQGLYTIRSAGSKGLFDVVAISSHFIILIQSKRNVAPTVAERKAMAEFKCPKNVIRQIWRFYGKGKLEISTLVNGEWVKKKVKK